MLGDAGRPAGILDDVRLLLATYPVRRFGGLQGNGESGIAQCRGHLNHRRFGLNGPAQARANFVAQLGEALVGPVIFECRIADAAQRVGQRFVVAGRRLGET